MAVSNLAALMFYSRSLNEGREALVAETDGEVVILEPDRTVWWECSGETSKCRNIQMNAHHHV